MDSVSIVIPAHQAKRQGAKSLDAGDSLTAFQACKALPRRFLLRMRRNVFVQRLSRKWFTRPVRNGTRAVYFAEVGVVASTGRLPCAAGIHYRHMTWQLITDNRRAMARALLTCVGERLAVKNFFTARPVAIKLSSRFARRIFDSRTTQQKGICNFDIFFVI